MKLAPELKSLRHRLGQTLHLGELRNAIRSMQTMQPGRDPEWVIVYRTATGFCCMYHGAPVSFVEMLDVQIWSEEMDVQPWFIGF
jgi:hypothetical protein